MSYRHTVTVLTDEADGQRVQATLRAALYNVREDYASSGPLARTATVVKSEQATNKKRLIELAVWAAGEQAKQNLGLPSEWDQRHWLARDDAGSCGTACCIAGKVALDDGCVPAWAEYSISTSRLRMPDGSEGFVENYAQNALGLTAEKAGELFRERNTLADILRVVDELVNEPDVSVG